MTASVPATDVDAQTGAGSGPAGEPGAGLRPAGAQNDCADDQGTGADAHTACTADDGDVAAAAAAAGSATKTALARFFDAGARHAAGPDHQQLWSALADVASGGKGLRPALFHSVYLALGGDDERAAAEVGAALELLHSALVIHDDVIDGDTVRRGRPNVTGIFADDSRARGYDHDRATHYGETAAILAGDLALTGAVRVLALCGASQPTVARMLDLLDRALHLSAAGELTDVRLSMDADAEIADAVDMEYQKTAVYSFELPLQLASVLAGVEEYEPPLVEFGRLLGVTYQLHDDLDGMFGDEATIGKSVLTDLRGGKCTPLIAHARTTTFWPRIRPYLGSASPDAAAQVRALLEQSGSRAYVEELAQNLAAEARARVADLPIGPLLQGWVRLITERAA
ncbi:polyprenyl synthetase family protein [Pseudactinotalea sp. Z1732]|uniref:polyprenyl synthetase family protein n=1 Tax=Pseudactinotalea sp. Z1732 TaxID=3413026 RepID=UPI003C7DE677